jgi:hypothetical protein
MYEDTGWSDPSPPSNSPSDTQSDTQAEALDTKRLTEVSRLISKFRAAHGQNIEITSPELAQEASRHGISYSDLLKVQRLENAQTTLFRAPIRK